MNIAKPDSISSQFNIMYMIFIYTILMNKWKPIYSGFIAYSQWLKYSFWGGLLV